MFDFLADFSPGQLIGFVAVVGGLTLAGIAVIATQWRRVRVAEMHACLKQQMLDKGMSAAEIEQVMKANPDSKEDGEVSLTGNEAVDKAALVQRMVDNGYEGADIERVLKAYQPATKQPNEKPFANQM